jgi:alternative ribosome-rescue factor
MTQNKDKARQWDGKSRPTNDLYSKRWNEIFKTNPIAKEVRTPKYKLRVVKPKKGKGSFRRDNGTT